MKVTKRFYCIQEKKTYFKGDDYTGMRTDLTDLLERPKEVKVKKVNQKVKKKVIKAKK